MGHNVRLWSGQPIDATTGIPLGTLACVRINRAYTDWFSIHRGVKPCLMCASPWVFHLFKESYVRDIKDDKEDCESKSYFLSACCTLTIKSYYHRR